MSAISWFIADIRAKHYPYPWIPYWNTTVRLVVFLIITYLLFALKVAYEREKYLARHDALTTAVNRRFFLELLQQEYQRCYRYKHPVTLAYFDVDNFKTVNDNLGHPSGDRLLQMIVAIIKNQIRANDIYCSIRGR